MALRKGDGGLERRISDYFVSQFARYWTMERQITLVTG